jgi:hypothetical protein
MTQKAVDACCQSKSRKCVEFFSDKNTEKSLPQDPLSCYSLRVSNTTTTTTTTRPIVELVEKLSRDSKSSEANTSYPSKLGRLQGLFVSFAIDLDVYSEDGSIPRDKIVDLLERLIKTHGA